MPALAGRDREDDFAVRSYDWDGDMEALRGEVRGLEAKGGGDRLESVNEGLHAAASQLVWWGDDAVKVVFLVGDAGPHLDDEQDRDYAVEMRKALARGIKVHTVATSGLREFGEYVLSDLQTGLTGWQRAKQGRGQHIKLTGFSGSRRGTPVPKCERRC